MTDISHLLVLANEFPELTHMIFDSVGNEMIFVLQFTCKKIQSLIMNDTSIRWLSKYAVVYAEKKYNNLIKWSKNFGYGHNEFVAEAAAVTGNVEIVKWLYDNDYPCDENIIYEAAENDDLNMFKWAADKFSFDMDKVFGIVISNGYLSTLEKFTKRYHYSFRRNAFKKAAKNGQWEIFQYVAEANISRGINNEKLVRNTTIAAAKFGQVDFLKKIIASQYSEYVDKTPNVLYFAMERIHNLEFLKWMVSEGFQMDSDIYYAIASSCCENYQELFLWVRSQGVFPGPYLDSFVISRGRAGVKWAIKNEFIHPHWSDINRIFITIGDVKSVKWSIKHNHFQVTPDIFLGAVSSGNMKLIRFIYGHEFHNNVFDISKLTYKYLVAMNRAAVRTKKVEVVKFLIDNNLEKYHVLWLSASAAGNINILESLQHVEPTHAIRGCSEAAKNGHIEVVKWFFNAFPEFHEAMLTSNLFADAAASENSTIELLDFLKKEDCPYDVQVCRNVAKHGRLSTLIWLRKNEFPWNKSVMAAAKENNNRVVLSWLLKNFPGEE